MDRADRILLQLLQDAFPLAERPFAALGREAGISEKETMARVRALLTDGTLRRIGPILDSRALGFASTLAAAAVPEERIDEVAEVVNSYPGVTHNYIREAENEKAPWNMWFTLHAPDEAALSAALREIEERARLRVQRLDTVKMFKVSVQFEVGANED